MFFLASKIFWLLGQPLACLVFLTLICLIFYRKAWAKRLLVITAGVFVFCGIVPVGPVLIDLLENRVSAPEKLPAHVDGIIILGGAVNADSSIIHHQPQLNEWSERVFEMMKLSRAYPQAKIVYSGGAGTLHGEGNKEAEIVKKMLEDTGFPMKHFVFETRSRTTYENVAESRALVSPQAGENWLLVTSAFHIPRAMKVFEKQGWKVIPYPAGYIEDGSIKLWQFTDVSGNYWKLNVAAKEIIGIIAYELSGRV